MFLGKPQTVGDGGVQNDNYGTLYTESGQLYPADKFLSST